MTQAWRIAVVVPAEAAAMIAQALEPLADDVSMFDADPRSGRRPGEPQPASWAGDLWVAEVCVVEALAATQPDAARLTAALALAAAGAGVAAPQPRIEPVEERDWVAETYRAFPEIAIGRYRIRGSHIAEPLPPGRIGITIDAAVAFGTGEHETTRGCLIALDRLAREIAPRHVLDMGCGSGVLGIAAARTWPCRVRASDIDRRAASVAAENARINGVAARLQVANADGYRSSLVREGAPYELIFANILARPLVRLAPALARHLAPGGRAILSGLLQWQEAQVLSAHRAQGLRLLFRIREGDWSTLVLAR